MNQLPFDPANDPADDPADDPARGAPLDEPNARMNDVDGQDLEGFAPTRVTDGSKTHNPPEIVGRKLEENKNSVPEIALAGGLGAGAGILAAVSAIVLLPIVTPAAILLPALGAALLVSTFGANIQTSVWTAVGTIVGTLGGLTVGAALGPVALIGFAVFAGVPFPPASI